MNRVFVFSALCVSAISSLAAGDGLPPVRELVSQTLAACNVDREGNRSALNDLAAAQCYLGQFEAARKMLVPFQPDDIFQQVAHQQCARIEIELSGSTVNIPAALWADELGFMHYEAAQAFVERGEYDKALEHLDAMPKSVSSGLITFGVQLAQKLKSTQQPDHCRRMLLIWAACYDDAKSVFDYRDRHHFPQLVAWLVEFQERAKAEALCDRLRSILDAETDIDECGEFIGRAWAEYAVALHGLGDRQKATDALAQARRWMDKALNAKFDPDQRVHRFDYACSYAAIAARQAAVLGEEQAAAAYGQAYQFAALAVNPQYGEYAYEKIVDEQLRGGDDAGARQTIKRMRQPKFTAKSWIRICEHELVRGNQESARAAASAAVQTLDHDGFEPEMADEMARVAAVAALAGETSLASKLFGRALALSAANDEKNAYHGWIAGRQIDAGMLAGAFDTIQSIPDAEDRWRPQAKLCLALAKAEYARQKDK